MSFTSSVSSSYSYQASVKEQQLKQLGYTPFEYWKGPKPVIPVSKQVTRPKATLNSERRAAVAIKPILLPTGSSEAQQRPSNTAFHFLNGQDGIPAGKRSAYSTNMGGQFPNRGGTAGPAAFHVRDGSGSVELVSGLPPSYSRGQELPPRDNMLQRTGYEPWWNIRYWRKRTWGIVAAALIAVIIICVVAGVLVTKANRYPDYSKLNYTLTDTYSGTTFFDQFDYFTGYDPAEGFVHYVPEATAKNLNLTYASSKSAVLRVDTSVGNTSSPDASTGRFSVRISSKTQYDSGLFIFDIVHTPYGCGTWPALWLTDQTNWPENGEIDVMEAVNQATDGNQMTLHTTDNCDMNVKRLMTGTVADTNCYNATNDNAGCGVTAGDDSYGTGFNTAGGGVMAMEWRDEGIRMWQWVRSSIPADITAKTPDPSTWGEAKADFPNTDCSISSHFGNQSIIANIDLCGQYAGNVYSTSGCPSTCEDYVANYPSAFTNAYWEFGSFEVYKAS